MPQYSHCIKLTWLGWTVGWVVGNKTTWTFCRLLLLSTCSSSPFMLHAIALNLTYPLPLYTLVQLWRSCEAAHFRPCLHIAFPPPSNLTFCLPAWVICNLVFQCTNQSFSDMTHSRDFFGSTHTWLLRWIKSYVAPRMPSQTSGAYKTRLAVLEAPPNLCSTELSSGLAPFTGAGQWPPFRVGSS